MLAEPDGMQALEVPVLDLLRFDKSLELTQLFRDVRRRFLDQQAVLGNEVGIVLRKVAQFQKLLFVGALFVFVIPVGVLLQVECRAYTSRGGRAVPRRLVWTDSG